LSLRRHQQEHRRRQRRRRRRQRMYLTQFEVDAILQHPYFTVPFTEDVTNYILYRGRLHANVLTLRFNITRTFNETYMLAMCVERVLEHYVVNTPLRMSILYDLLLEGPSADNDDDSDVRQYYIWRANSNRRTFNDDNEIIMSVNMAELNRHCRNAANIHLPDLDVHFKSSKITIQRLIAIVFTFVEV